MRARARSARAQEQIEKQRGVVVKDTGRRAHGRVPVGASRRRLRTGDPARRRPPQPRATPTRACSAHRPAHRRGDERQRRSPRRDGDHRQAHRVIAPAGGIFASDTVHGVLGTARGELEDRGEFELKGIDAPWRLYEVPVGDDRGQRRPCRMRSARRSSAAPRSARSSPSSSSARARRSRRHGARSPARPASARVASSRRGAPRRGEPGMACSSATASTMDGAAAVPTVRRAARAGGAPGCRPRCSAQAARRERARGRQADARAAAHLRRHSASAGDAPARPGAPLPAARVQPSSSSGPRSRRRSCSCSKTCTGPTSRACCSSSALAQIAAELPLLLVGTYRPRRGRARPPARRARCEDLTAPAARRPRSASARLTRGGCLALLAGRAGQTPPAELVSLVYAETEGNPFFVEEVFLHLNERGQAVRRRRAAGAPASRSPTPKCRAASASSSNSASSASSDDVPQGRSRSRRVAGQTLPLRPARRRSRASTRTTLLDALEEAARATLIEDESAGREVVLRLRARADPPDPARRSSPRARRQRLHLRMADAMEALHGRRSAERTRRRHRAPPLPGGRRRAAASARRTGWCAPPSARSTRSPSRTRSAISTPRGPCSPANDAEGAVRVLRLRARALRGLARIDEALAALADALEIAPPGVERDAMLQARARLQLDLFRGREAIEDLEPCSPRTRAPATARARSSSSSCAAARLYILSLDEPGYAEKTRASYEETYALAKEIGDKRAMCQALIPTSWFTDYWLDYRDQAIAQQRRGARPRRGARRRGARDRGGVGRGSGCCRSGRPTRRRCAFASASRHAATRCDSRSTSSGSCGTTGCAPTSSSAWRPATTASRSRAQLGSPPVQYASIKGLALTDLGRFDEAWAAFQAEVADDAHPFGRCMRELGIAIWLEALGALDRAEAAAKEVLEEAGTAVARLDAEGHGGPADDRSRRGAASQDAGACRVGREEGERDRLAARAAGRRAEAALARGDFAQALALADQSAASDRAASACGALASSRSSSQRARWRDSSAGTSCWRARMRRWPRPRRRAFALGRGGSWPRGRGRAMPAATLRVRATTARAARRAARRYGRAHRRPGAAGGVRGRSRSRGGEEPMKTKLRPGFSRGSRHAPRAGGARARPVRPLGRGGPHADASVSASRGAG